MASLSGTRFQEEEAYAKRMLEHLGEHRVNYSSEYVTPQNKRPKRMPALSMELGEPPELDTPGASTSTTGSDTIFITVKSLKPPMSFPIQAHVTDSIAHLKSLVASSSPSGSASSSPAVDFQRLLLKGKALADAKLVKEYDIKDGAVLTMVLKAGWDEKERREAANTLGGDPTDVGAKIPTEAPPSAGTIPTLVLSANDEVPAEASTSTTTTAPQPLRTSAFIPGKHADSAPSIGNPNTHAKLADPTFWQSVHQICRETFVDDFKDADGVWRGLLMGVEARLSAGEIAKIIDVVGVDGMGGTHI